MRLILLRALGVMVAIASAACLPKAVPPPLPADFHDPTPPPARIEGLVYLIGDAGDALPGQSPVLEVAKRDIEEWAQRLPHGAVSVALLGDLVYPVGIRDDDVHQHPEDTLALHAQLELIEGPSARAKGVEGLFIPGNHDWDHGFFANTVQRLQNLARRLDQWRDAGHNVRMWPRQTAIEPGVKEVGNHHVLLGLDTQDWLHATPERRAEFEAALETALRRAGDRTVVVMSHHPLQSAGEHGDLHPRVTPLGFIAALSRAGTMVQDASSLRYRMVIDAARSAFRATGKSPLVWAAGHDHTLQLLRGRGADWPTWTVVSGSASKVAQLGTTPDLEDGVAAPGYARLFLLDDGTALLQFVAGDPDSVSCKEAPDPAICVAEAVPSYSTIYSRTLR